MLFEPVLNEVSLFSWTQSLKIRLILLIGEEDWYGTAIAKYPFHVDWHFYHLARATLTVYSAERMGTKGKIWHFLMKVSHSSHCMRRAECRAFFCKEYRDIEIIVLCSMMYLKLLLAITDYFLVLLMAFFQSSASLNC